MAIRLKPLAQQTIVITGGSSGIGLATALSAARQGARVFLVARNGDALREVQEQIIAAGGEADLLAIDVAEEGWAARVAGACVARFGGFDTWVNDAAAAVYAKVEDMSLAEHRRVFDVGYFGLVEGSIEAARHLRQSGGALINIGSVLSERTMVYQGSYSAMKHAVLGFTDALRMELMADNAPVSVTLIKPTGMDTPYPEHARNKMDKPARIPPIVYDPRLVARAILFAAANPRRDLTVGGTGLAISKGGNIAPGIMDFVMARLVGEPLQQTDQAPPPGTTDNLFEPRADGSIDSRQDNGPRRTSLWLEAQMRPGLATAAMVGTGLLAAGLVRASRR